MALSLGGGALERRPKGEAGVGRKRACSLLVVPGQASRGQRCMVMECRWAGRRELVNKASLVVVPGVLRLRKPGQR